MKKIILLSLITMLLLPFTNTYALTTIHEEVTKQKLTSGATLKNYQRFTDEGWLNINMMEVNLKDKNTKVKLLTSENGFSTFQTVLEMAKAEDCVAAINGDFFGGNYQFGCNIGFSYEDEHVLTSSTLENDIKPQYASLMVTKDHTAFTDFVTNQLSLKSMLTGESLSIKLYNRAADDFDVAPAIFTKEWGNTTLGNSKYPPQTEMVVQNNQVIDIRENQEVAEIPEDGFILVTSGASSEFVHQNFKVGTRVQLSMEYNVDLENLQTAISGGAILVQNGKMPESFSSVIYGRNPRTAIGISKDKQTIYFITVDGRQQKSIGMTQEELAEFLIEKGIDTAINLDGGGSTTMVGRPLGEETLSIINLPSGGAYLRKVANGLALINTGKKTSLSGLTLSVVDDNVFVGCNRKLTVKGYDSNDNPVPIDIEDIHFETSGVSASIKDGVLHAGDEAGVITITAKKGKVSTSIEMNILSAPNELEVLPKKAEIKQTESQTFTVIAKNKNGFYGTLESKDITWNVLSGEGSFEDGKYIPKTAGLHLIEISAGNAKTYAVLNVISIEEKTHRIVQEKNYSLVTYPNEVEGKLSEFDKNYLKLKYNFENTELTRAAYVRLKTPITIEEKDILFSLPIISKKQISEYVKIKVIDRDGDMQLVMLQRGFDADEEEHIISCSLEDIKKPATITDIYIGQDNKEILESGTIYFGNPIITKKGDTTDLSFITLPQDIKGTDASCTNPSQNTSFQIAIYDTMVEEVTLLDHYKNMAAMTHMQQDADIIILNSHQNVEETEMLRYPNSYTKESFPNVDMITLDVSNGGLRKTDYTQWFTFENDIKDSDNTNIIIVMKGSLDCFTDEDEKLLFINTLRDLKASLNKNIWVIERGNYTEYSMEKRVKYLSINNLNFDTSEPILVGQNTKYLLISVTPTEMTYEIKRVF